MSKIYTGNIKKISELQARNSENRRYFIYFNNGCVTYMQNKHVEFPYKEGDKIHFSGEFKNNFFHIRKLWEYNEKKIMQLYVRQKQREIQMQ